MKKNLIKNLLDKLSGADESTSEGFVAFDKGVAKLKDELRKKIQIGTLDEVNDKLDSFRRRIDLDPIIEAVQTIQSDMVSRETELKNAMEERAEELRGELSEARGSTKDNLSSLQSELSDLESQIKELVSKKPPEMPDFAPSIREAEDRLMTLLKSNSSDIEGIRKGDKTKDLEKGIKDLETALDKLRVDLVNRINERGGGNMNRQVLFNTTNYLKKFTDYNLIAGSNVTFTIAENTTAKRVNLTISASSSGGGRVRLIQSVAVDTAMGNTANTDYVYLVSGTTSMTLPTAVGNDNLYTIKNVGTGVVTVVGTIDGAANVVMPVQYTSVDIISNGTDWNIT